MANKLVAISVSILLSLAGVAQSSNAVIERLSIPGPLIFDEKPYNLSWSSHPSATYYKQEYLVKGDSADRFNSMILLEVLTGGSSLKNVVSTKLAELKQMKTNNPVVNYDMMENKKTGEYMIDFSLSANDAAGKINIVERNIYRYKNFTDQSGKTGVLLFGISTRAYNSGVQQFIIAAKTNKNVLANKALLFKIPVVIIK